MYNQKIVNICLWVWTVLLGLLAIVFLVSAFTNFNAAYDILISIAVIVLYYPFIALAFKINDAKF